MTDAPPQIDSEPLERAIRAFNSGSDPSASGLQRAFLAAQVSVAFAAEPDVEAPDTWRMVAEEQDGTTFLVVFSGADRVPREFGERHPYFLTTTGRSVVEMAKDAGITINPGSPRELAVAVLPGGVQQMREVDAAQAGTRNARAHREPTELESALAGLPADGVPRSQLESFAEALWPATLLIPSARPLEATIDPDACVSLATPDGPMVAAFTAEDQVADLASTHLTPLTGRQLYFRLPTHVSIVINPSRVDERALSRPGLNLIASIVERRTADEALHAREQTPLERAIVAARAEGAAPETRLAVLPALYATDAFVVSDQPFPPDYAQARPLTFPTDDGPYVAVFTAEDQIGDFGATHRYRARVGIPTVIHSAPEGGGLLVNPNREVFFTVTPTLVADAKRQIAERLAGGS